MSRNIIALAGFAQSGKDSVGKILTTKYGYKRLAFADALRKSLYNLNPLIPTHYSADILASEDTKPAVETHVKRLQEIINEIGWDEAKVKFLEIRELLQRLGTESGREIHGQNCWTEIVRRMVEAEPNQDFVITDCRFPNELTEIKAWGGVTYKVLRDVVTSVNEHVSDKDLEGVYLFIENNGTFEDLENKVAQILKPIDKPEPCLI